MRVEPSIREVVAWVVLAAAVMVVILSAPDDPSQRRFVECIENTSHAHPDAKFDEINAFCSGHIGQLS